MGPKRKDRIKNVPLTPQDAAKAAERIQKLRITIDPAEITASLKELIPVSTACEASHQDLTQSDLENWAGIHSRFVTCMFDNNLVLTAETHDHGIDEEISNYPVLLSQSLRVIADGCDAWVGDPQTLCALCSLILVVTHPENIKRAFHIVGQKAACDIANSILHIFTVCLAKMHAAENVDVPTVDRINTTCIALRELAQCAHLPAPSGNDAHENSANAHCTESDDTAPCDASADEKSGTGEVSDVSEYKRLGDVDTCSTQEAQSPIGIKSLDEALVDGIKDPWVCHLDKHGEIPHVQSLCHEKLCWDRLCGIFMLVAYAGWYLGCVSYWTFWSGGL